MARTTNLKAVSVYMNDHQIKDLGKAAALENRSVSNYLLNLGLERAVELGVPVHGFRSQVANVSTTNAKKRRVAGR